MTARQRARRWYHFSAMVALVSADLAMWTAIAWAGSEAIRHIGGF